MTIPSEALWPRIQALASAAIEIWAVGDGAAPGDGARDELAVLASGGSDALSTSMTEHLSRTLAVELARGEQWTDEPLGSILRGLHSALRQLRRSSAVQTAIDACQLAREAIRLAERAAPVTELMSAVMVIEDSVMAVSAYEEAARFEHASEAYLAKYGLLQALQAGFDAAQTVCRSVGVPSRADRLPGGKSVLVVRNIVAGHPVGGTMSGRSWHHFHDRQSVQDKDMIRVMSFDRSDRGNWTGQTVDVAKLISDGLAVITELLRRAATFGDDPSGRQA